MLTEIEGFVNGRLWRRGGALLVVLMVLWASPAQAHPHYKHHKHYRKYRVRLRHRVDRIARDYLGVPYVFGGNSEHSIDCSGLTMNVYQRAFGYNLPHSAALQATFGARPHWRYVWKSWRLRRGDLVYWKNTYKPGVSHAGVYVGKGTAVMAHGTGDRSSVTDIRSSYYRAHYAHGIRPPPLRLPRFR